MKKIQYLASAFVMAVMLVSCGGDTAKDGEASNDDANNEQQEEVAESKNCTLQSFSFKLGESGRTMNFKYNEGVLDSVETVTMGRDMTQSMAYTYNENGTMATFQLDETIATYVYDESGRLTQITGEGSLNTRTFEYDDAGNIVKQVTMFGDKPFTTHEYIYENGAPIKVTISDKNGEATEENTITYDDKANPFAGKGLFSNSMEMMMGYPVGNYAHNAVSIEKTYLKKSSWKVDGEYKMPGDKESNDIKYEYNEVGYPTAHIRVRGDKEIRTELTYICE